MNNNELQIWSPLPRDEAHRLYRVPQKIALDEKNVFYCIRDSGSLDGPYPIIALIAHPNKTLCSLHFKSLEPEDFETTEFNLFDEPGLDHLSLWLPRHGEELVSILSSYANRLEKPASSPKMFRLVPESELGFRIDAWDEYVQKNSEQALFLQEYNPGPPESAPATTTYLQFSAPLLRPRSLTLWAIQFDPRAINVEETTRFDLLQMTVARIVLNQQGLLELCEMIRSYLHWAD